MCCNDVVVVVVVVPSGYNMSVKLYALLIAYLREWNGCEKACGLITRRIHATLPRTWRIHVWKSESSLMMDWLIYWLIVWLVTWVVCWWFDDWTIAAQWIGPTFDFIWLEWLCDVMDSLVDCFSRFRSDKQANIHSVGNVRDGQGITNAV